MSRGALALVTIAIVAAAVSTARADDTLGQCIAGATAALRSQGARPIDEPMIDFMLEGQSRAIPFTLDEAGCVGVLAVGHRRVHDIDLALYTESGIALVQDVEVDARPYVRFCGAEGLTLVATLHMYKGQGEVRLVRFADAPADLPDLHRTVGECFAGGGGMRRPSADVGPPPPGRPLAEQLEEVRAELGALGYSDHDSERSGTLQIQQREAHAMSLPPGRCYAVAAVGDAGVIDLDLFVRTPVGVELARDVERDASAVARLCVDDQPAHVVEVRMFQGAGDYRVRAFVLDEQSASPAPAGLAGFARIAYAEAAARMRQRGMAPRPVGWGWLGPGERLAMPVRLEAGRCYAFAGAPADETASGDLDLMLLDDDETLLGRDVGTGNVPLLWHCAERSGIHRVVGRVYGAAGRYLVLIGEDGQGSPQASAGRPGGVRAEGAGGPRTDIREER